MLTPVLSTKRLILRPFSKSDVQDVFDCWESNPEVAKYMFWSSHNDINKTQQWVNYELEQIPSDTWFRWAVIQKETDILIGTGLIYLEPEYNEFEIGYNFGQSYWGNGFATEAMLAIIKFGKETLHLKQIIGRYAKDNSASENVMKKLGFTYCKDIPYEANEGSVIYEGKECRLYFN